MRPGLKQEAEDGLVLPSLNSLVLVEWMDAASSLETEITDEGIERDLVSLMPQANVGRLVRVLEGAIVLAYQWTIGAESEAGLFLIPRGCVRRVTRLRPARSRIGRGATAETEGR